MSNTKKDFQRSVILGEGDSDINGEKKGFIAWVNAHKKELIIAGISIVALIATMLGINNKDVLLELWRNLKVPVTKPSAPVKKLSDIVSDSPTVSAIEEEKVPVVKAMECVSTPQHSFDVRGHIRNLHSGWKASAKKISEAEMLGISLLPGQTLVDGYTKGALSA